jgi:hypothetical protein
LNPVGEARFTVLRSDSRVPQQGKIDMARTPTKQPAAKKPAAKARKPAAKAKATTKKAAPKKAAPKKAARTAGPSTNDRVNILEMQVQDLQGTVANLRHVLASALRQTPNLLPLYMQYLQGYGEDGGGGK